MPTLQLSDLQTIRMEHIHTAIDVSACLDDVFRYELTGRSVWGAQVRDVAATLRWRWGALRQLIVVLDPHRIETNVHWIEQPGAEVSTDLVCIHLLEYLETLPWRPIVQAHLPCPPVNPNERS